jgi:hypothetical protein
MCGGSESHHFLFPACENRHIDPNQPMRSWRSAWRKLTRVIECPACRTVQEPGTTCANSKCHAGISGLTSPLAGLRFHDLRHQAITELAESQASDQTIMAISGHVSAQMLKHYSHIRLEAKRQALDALAVDHSQRASRSGYVTTNVTNAGFGEAAGVVSHSKEWSGREDLNLRPPGPEPGALPGCATPRPGCSEPRGPLERK